VSGIYEDADLGGIIEQMRAAEADTPGPFFKTVVALIDDINIHHQPDTNGDCGADGCQSMYGEPEFNSDWPCPVWMRANNVAVAWLRERAANQSDRTENPQRVSARERKRRQREREADSPVKANGNPSPNPSPKGSGNPSGNPTGDRVTATSPGDLFSEEPQVEAGSVRPESDRNPSGVQAVSPRDGLRDSHGDTPGDNLSEPLRTSTKLSETSAR
jgi:hypothetical protein